MLYLIPQLEDMISECIALYLYCIGVLTSLLQSHHGGLLYQVSLYEAPEILAVHTEVWQLECVDGHLERELLAGTLAGHLQPRKGDDSRAGVGDATGQTLL